MSRSSYTVCMSQWVVSLPDRLDAFLSKESRMLSRTKAQTSIEKGRVFVNDECVIKVAFRLQEGDTVTLQEDVNAEADTHTQPVDLELPVLYEDESCLVINKPSGIAVHPGAGMSPDEKTLLNGIAFLFQERKIPFSPDGVLVHRLDRETTGCLLVAKSPEAHRTLQMQFEKRSVEKFYLAIVAGVPSPEAAVVDASIGRSTYDRTKMTILGSSRSREARTTYRTLEKGKNCALLLCELHTGRTHQIRVHLSSIDHPILGDGTYTNLLSERVSEEFAIHDLCLHAWKLSFTPLHASAPVTVTAPPPSSFIASLRQAGLRPEIPSF